jgi:hypothetical protein
MLVNKKLDIYTFYRHFSIQLKKHYPILTKKTARAKSLRGKVSIGGLYYPTSDQTGKKSISVIFQFNTADTDMLISTAEFDIICKLIADSILHEIIHLCQYRKRNFKELPLRHRYISAHLTTRYQLYLGNVDELEAHSFNIACELFDEFVCVDTARLMLTTENYHEHVSSSTLQTYIKHFKNTNNDLTLLVLKQCIIANLPNAASGKPIDILLDSEYN